MNNYTIRDGGFDEHGHSMSNVYLGDKLVLQARPWEAREFVKLMALSQGKNLSEAESLWNGTLTEE